MKGNGVFVKKLTETGSLLDTDPSNYIGYDVDPKTGQMVKKSKDGENKMSDPQLHAKTDPDHPDKQPAINVQAEAYKPGFSISLFMEGDSNFTVPESVDLTIPLKALNFVNHVKQTYPNARMVFEDTTTGEKGLVTPAMFVKVYSKMLLSEQDKGKSKDKEQPQPMSESNTSKAANLPLATELMNIGLVNNVKGTAKVLKEENPMRKAMEIFYASEKSNANADEKKAEYVPSQLKEGKMVFETKTKAVPEEKEPVVESKKKRPVIW